MAAVNDLQRYRQGATKLGLPLAVYVAGVEAGNKWCSGHRGWEPRAAFGTHQRLATGLNTICRDWDRASSRARQARYRAERRAS